MEQYQYIICPFLTLILCQIIKFIFESIRDKKINLSRFFNGTGGMPSSHTSFTSSLTVLLGFNLGFDSPIFAVALVFTFIIAYDAIGLRFESGKQAEAINLINKELGKSKKKGFKLLKEQLGHKPLEVLVGLLLGTITGLLFNIYI